MDNSFNKTIRKRNAAKLVTLFLLIVIFGFIFAFAFNCYSSFIVANEVGQNFGNVYLKNLSYKLVIQLLSFLLIFTVVFSNLLIVRKNLKNLNLERGFLGNTLILVCFSAVLSLFTASLISSNLYEKLFLFKNSVSFDLKDPIFFKDISYYVFKREFIVSVISSCMSVFGISFLLVLISYFSLFIRLGERTVIDFISNKILVVHIMTNAIFYSIFAAVSVYISRENILFSKFASELTGAGFIQDRILVFYYSVLSVLVLFFAALLFYSLISGKYKFILRFAFIIAFIIVAVNITTFVLKAFYVSPNEITVESEYIANNIAYTKKAYNIEKIDETEYKYDINNTNSNYDEDTLNNLRILDYQSTITATNQLQGLRNYYQFKDMDVTLYDINGSKKAVLSGARELDTSNLNDSAHNYINDKFRYTHGYGIVMASLNSINANGEPEYYVKDIKHSTFDSDILVKEPRIYFGELESNNVIVNSTIKELDYPEGAKDKEYSYKGEAGIKLTPINRLVFALKTGDFRMIISRQVTSESKLLTNQNIIDRLNTVAPFIKFDNDVYVVVDSDGSLKWIADGYTYTDKYPYSQYSDNVNYIRNSVKAVVDAYNGDVKLYIIDKSDPIVKAYDNIYPGLFEKEELSSYLKGKLKYPEWLFSVQSEIYSKYHINDVETFYNKSDLYTVANEKYSDEVKTIEPYYNILKLDEYGEDAQLVLMLPFTLYNRENMTAWLSVGNEGENYGKLISYRFPKDVNIYGPLQIENMIDNNPEISKELTLWDSGGSKVIRGNLLIIPINNSILYIEPVYLTADNKASLPELKRVIAVYGNNVIMADNVSDAIKKSMGISFIQRDDTTEVTSVDITSQDDKSDIQADRLIEIYDEIEKNFKSGDWEAFGTSLNSLKSYVDELKDKNSIDK